MTVTAERVLAEIKALPPAELREVWQGLSLTLSEPPSPRLPAVEISASVRRNDNRGTNCSF